MSYSYKDHHLLSAKLNEFLLLYGKLYPDDAKIYIYNMFESNIINGNYIDITDQIAALLELYSEDENPYKQMLEIIKENYDIGTDIIEVSCGFIPILAKYLSEEQQRLGRGSITTYDPMTIDINIPGVRINRHIFDRKTDLSHCKLIIGRWPCEATELIIKRANAWDIDFLIVLCGHSHDGSTKDINKWYNDIYELANRTKRKNKVLKLEYPNHPSFNGTPILYTRNK